jgi:hypothetical protein
VTKVRLALLVVLLCLGACAGTKVSTPPAPAAAAAPAPAQSPAPEPPAEPIKVSERKPASVDPTRESVVPPEQSETGDATLRLRLRSDLDGAPVELKVRLWRLGVPETERWTAGDEIRATFVVPIGGDTVGGLPGGRYRIECLDHRDTWEDPPAFTLAKDDGERVVDVPNRPWFRVRVPLVDESGARIDRSVGRRGASASGSSMKRTDPPGWATPRRSKTVDAPPSSSSGVGANGHGQGERIGTPVEATSDGFFELAPRQQERAGEYHRWSHWFATDDRSDVLVSVWKNSIDEDTTFVGVAAQLDVLLSHVANPDGTSLDPATAKIEFVCRAVRRDWTPPADAWRTVPVHVKIVKSGCEPLAFDWTAATADTPHALVASPPDSRK